MATVARHTVRVLVSSLAVVAFSMIGLAANRALANGEAALDDCRETVAVDRAGRVEWAPWSAQAHRLLAEAQLAGGIRRVPPRTCAGVVADSRDWTLWFALGQTDIRAESAHALAEARRLTAKPRDRFLRLELLAGR